MRVRNSILICSDDNLFGSICCFPLNSNNSSSGCENNLLDGGSLAFNFLSKLSSEYGLSEVIVITSFLNDFTMFGLKLCDFFILLVFLYTCIIKCCKHRRDVVVHARGVVLHGFHIRVMFAVRVFDVSVDLFLRVFGVSLKFVEVIFCCMSQFFLWLFNYLIIWENIVLEFDLKAIFRRWMFRDDGEHFIFNGS